MKATFDSIEYLFSQIQTHFSMFTLIFGWNIILTDAAQYMLQDYFNFNIYIFFAFPGYLHIWYRFLEVEANNTITQQW